MFGRLSILFSVDCEMRHDSVGDGLHHPNYKLDGDFSLVLTYCKW